MFIHEKRLLALYLQLVNHVTVRRSLEGVMHEDNDPYIQIYIINFNDNKAFYALTTG